MKIGLPWDIKPTHHVLLRNLRMSHVILTPPRNDVKCARQNNCAIVAGDSKTDTMHKWVLTKLNRGTKKAKTFAKALIQFVAIALLMLHSYLRALSKFNKRLQISLRPHNFLNLNSELLSRKSSPLDIKYANVRVSANVHWQC